MKVLDHTLTQLTIPTPFPVGDVHVYLLKGDQLTLIDAGVKTREGWEALETQLRHSGYKPEDIEQIILTHHHPDHIGLTEQFPRAETLAAHRNTGVYLSRDETYFAKHEAFFKQLFASCGVPAELTVHSGELSGTMQFAGKGELTMTLDEGDTLPGHHHWQVIETKGHAQSHLSFFRERDGAFIGGDHLLHDISPNPLLEAPIEGDIRPQPLLQYRANLLKCQSLGIQTVYPGHGNIFSDVGAVIPVHLQNQEKRAARVYQFLQSEAQTPFALSQQLFPNKYMKQLSLTMSETIGQLDYLEEQGLAACELTDGIYHYYLIS